MRLIDIKRVMEGRMGNDFTPAYDVYVDGAMVGYAKRLWLAKAIGAAVAEGRIESTGDTTGRLADWAYKNDLALYERICKSGE